MLQTLVNALKTPELRKKILYTAMIILIFRIGAAISVPFTNAAQGIIDDTTSAGNFMNYLNMMTGDAFNYSTLFAMSITPYINASIIMQLLGVAIPALERLSKEGDVGRKNAADHPSRRGHHRPPVHRILFICSGGYLPWTPTVWPSPASPQSFRLWSSSSPSSPALPS